MPSDFTEVNDAIALYRRIADKISNTPQPNEEIDDIYYDDFKKEIVSSYHKIKNTPDEDLISCVNSLIKTINISDVDHLTASRGALIAHSQMLEAFHALQKIRDIARTAGCRDPDAKDLSLSSTASAKQLTDINKKLEEIQAYAEDLDSRIKKDYLNAISLSLGPFSIGVGALIGIVKSTAASTQKYLSSAESVNSQTLQDKFELVNSSARSLMNIIAEESKLFGKNILMISRKIAKAAADAYISGLTFIKNSITNRKKEGDISSLYSNDYEPIPDTLIDDDLKNSSGDYAQAATRIASNILITIKGRPSGHYVGTDDVTQCKFMKSHEKRYISVYFGSKNISFTCQISEKEYQILSHFDASRLNRIFEKTQKILHR